jgi:hypothetical protein
MMFPAMTMTTSWMTSQRPTRPVSNAGVRVAGVVTSRQPGCAFGSSATVFGSSTSLAAQRLRQEAQWLRVSSEVIRRQVDHLTGRANQLDEDALRLEQEADDIDELATAEEWIGPVARGRRGRRAT